MVAIGAMARSFKDAQTLLTPVYFLCFTPSLIAGLGDWELGGAVALVPGVNVTLLARDLILGKATFFHVACSSSRARSPSARSRSAWPRASTTPSASSPPTRARCRLFAWVRRLVGLGGRDPAAASDDANPGHSLALFGIGFLLVLLAGLVLRRHLTLNILVTQWVCMFGLVALYARSIGRPLVEVLRLRRVPGRALAGATLVGLSAWLVLGMLAQWFLKPPKELEESIRHLIMPNDGARGVGLTLLLVGLTPALCEESLFRGAILRGFSARLPRLTSAVLTGVLFGLFHLDLWRLLPTAILGVGLSLIALETGSIVPSMLKLRTSSTMPASSSSPTSGMTTSAAPIRALRRSSACSWAVSSSSPRGFCCCAGRGRNLPTRRALHEVLFGGRGAVRTHSVGEVAMTTNGEDKRAIGLLRKCDVLSDIPVESLAVLGPNLKLGNYRPRQVIYLPGDRAQGVHFLTNGRIKISKVTRDGKELTLAYRTEGDFFGEPCLLEGGPREEMAEAMDASVTVEVDREQLDQLLKTNGVAAYKFSRALIARRKDLETRVEQLIFKDRRLEARRALAQPRGTSTASRTSAASSSASRSRTQEMANLIGSTRETVRR